MSYDRPIGGYFELETPRRGYEPPAGAILLNSARSAFEYVLRSYAPRRVHIPKFTCDVLLEPLDRLNIKYSFYSINQDLEIANKIELDVDEMLLYTNYFGLKHDYATTLENKYGKSLIYDCAQAFFSPPLSGAPTFYSPRKFFGLPDGGVLTGLPSGSVPLPDGSSIDRMGHLLRRIESGPRAGYDEYRRNDMSLSEQGMTAMSELTRRMLLSIDATTARNARHQNFMTLHDALGDSNKLTKIISATDAPLCYPYFATPEERSRLIENNIFVPMYWPNVIEWTTDGEIERELALNILPLPIDHRYDINDMQRIIEVING